MLYFIGHINLPAIKDSKTKIYQDSVVTYYLFNIFQEEHVNTLDTKTLVNVTRGYMYNKTRQYMHTKHKCLYSSSDHQQNIIHVCRFYIKGQLLLLSLVNL